MPLKTILESSHHIDFNFARGHGDFGGARSVKVVCFKRTLRAIEAVIGVHPSTVGSVGESIGCSDENPCRDRLVLQIDHSYRDSPYRFGVFALSRDYFALLSTGNCLLP